MAEAVHLEEDSAAREEAETDALPDFRPGELSDEGWFKKEKNCGGCAKADESSEAGVKPTAAARDELGLENAGGFDEREAERPENGGHCEHSHRLEM